MVASVDNVAIRWHGSDGPPLELLRRLGMEELSGKWPQEVLQLGARIGGGLTARCGVQGWKMIVVLSHMGVTASYPVCCSSCFQDI
jgi:hypothetical protein